MRWDNVRSGLSVLPRWPPPPAIKFRRSKAIIKSATDINTELSRNDHETQTAHWCDVACGGLPPEMAVCLSAGKTSAPKTTKQKPPPRGLLRPTRASQPRF